MGKNRAITTFSNEICPKVELGDLNVFLVLITDLTSVLSYHLNLLRNRHI